MQQYLKWAIFAVITTLPLVLVYNKSKSRKRILNEEYWYDYIFVNQKNTACYKHLQLKKPCSDQCSLIFLEKILNLFSQARQSISVCVYLITLHEVAAALIACHKNGINVRVITDYEMIPCGNKMVEKLKDAGICIKSNGYYNLMHHKFVIIDVNSDSAKVMFGSLNLSMQAILKNFENSIITNNKQLINKLNEEFEYLWETLTPY